MKKIHGYPLIIFPFPNLERIGALLYHEFPSTIVYADEFNNIIILEWVDFDEEGGSDKYIIYQSTKNNLEKFINEFISHYDFIKNSKNNFIVSFDGKLGSEKKFQVVFFDELPKEYLPKQDVYFEKDEGVELDKVVSFFKLKLQASKSIEKLRQIVPLEESNKILDEVSKKEILTTLSRFKKPTISQKEILKVVAEQQQSEVINLHLKEGQNVGFGTIETHVLGEILTKFDGLYREAALDFYEGVSRNNLRSLNTKRGKSLYSKITTEIVLNQAASYSVFIRPVLKDIKEINELSISQSIFSLFEKSGNTTSLDEIKNHYSVFVYKSYKEFLDVIKDSKVEIDCNLYNPFNNTSVENEFAAKKASQLLENINQLIQVENEKFKLEIKFDAINCNTRHYTFMHNGDYFSGHFDKKIKESITSLSFKKTYDITLERKIEQIVGSKDIKITDIIISCIQSKAKLP